MKTSALSAEEHFLSRRSLLKQATMSALLCLAWSKGLGSAEAAGKDKAQFPWAALLPVLVPIKVKDPQATFSAIAKAVDGELQARMPTLEDGLLSELRAIIQRKPAGVSRDKLIEALKKIETHPDFSKFMTVVSRHSFRNPEIWAAIGYQGSSVEYGGYLERGFNDISWL